jgi:predicted RNA binding protein YcfA (HicA-like mRNA interferase family)
LGRWSTANKTIGKLKADLYRAGWQLARQRGSHQIFSHPLLPGDRVEIAGHNDGQEAKRYQERDVAEAVKRAEAARRKP